MTGYEQAIEVKMQRLFATLSEKDRRRYAGIEAAKLAHGGIDYIAQLFGMDPKTIRRGLLELDLTDNPTSDRVRKKRWRQASGA
ncbi:MAG: hypothetical protein ACREVA_06705 [Burkholderiales bacterium]